MATIFVNGCFDILHDGHVHFLEEAKYLGGGYTLKLNTIAWKMRNRLIVAINSDESARKLKAAKWGEKYPRDPLQDRVDRLIHFADEVWSFNTEEELYKLIQGCLPCVICKGPDYAGKRVTGDDLAPVIILDTPEPESVKQMKREIYG